MLGNKTVTFKKTSVNDLLDSTHIFLESSRLFAMNSHQLLKAIIEENMLEGSILTSTHKYQQQSNLHQTKSHENRLLSNECRLESEG